MKIGDLIKDFRSKNKLSQEDFGRMCSLSKGYISMLESGKNPSTNKPIFPTVETIKQIGNALGVDFNYLIKILGPEQKISMANGVLTQSRNKKLIPIFGYISAGLPLLATEHVESYEEVDDLSVDYGLIVKGDSMVGARIHNNDVVYISMEKEVINGDIVVALINGDDATIKRFYQYGDKIVLRPENPNMKEREYSVNEVNILGKVETAKIYL